MELAEATSEKDCVDRHRSYHIDVWKESMNSLQKARLEAIAKLIPDGWKCLDVGCNSGYMSLVSTNCRWWGVDVQEDLVEIAKRRMIEAFVAPAERMPFENETFELACVAEILEHVFDPEAVMREAVRVTSRKIIGSTPHERGNWGPGGMHPVDGHKYHVRCYTETELFKLLEPFGFVEIETLEHAGRRQMYVFSVELSQAGHSAKRRLT